MKTKPTKPASDKKYLTGYYPSDVATAIEMLACNKDRSTNYILNKLMVYALKNADKALK